MRLNRPFSFRTEKDALFLGCQEEGSDASIGRVERYPSLGNRVDPHSVERVEADALNFLPWNENRRPESSLNLQPTCLWFYPPANECCCKISPDNAKAEDKHGPCPDIMPVVGGCMPTVQKEEGTHSDGERADKRCGKRRSDFILCTLVQNVENTAEKRQSKGGGNAD